MNKTRKLIKDYEGYEFSSGGVTGEDFKSFARKFFNVIKEQIGEEGALIKKSPNHYDLSGFVQNNKTGKIAYFSISDVRYFTDEWIDHVLIRTAEHDRDFRGGRNQYTPLLDFGETFLRITQ